jgi:protein-disulfide isomerase
MANLAFLILIAVMFLSDENKKSGARRNLLIAAIGIFAGSVVMGAISAMFMAQFCLFCITAYVLSLLLLIFTWLAVRGTLGPLRVGDFRGLVIVAIICFIGGFVVNSSASPNGAQKPEVNAMLNSYIQEWKTASAQNFKLVDPLVKGPENAKMTIVEFADYRCIHCKHAAPVLHAFATAHPDVRLEFQPWPLDGECNSSLNQANGASCLLSRASWCAQKNKNAGWAVHDYIYGLPEIYSSLEAIKGDLANIARAAGMSEQEMKACTDSDAAKTAVREQANVGTNLNLQGTPSIYVNNKQLSGGQTMQVLQRAYEAL